MPPRTPTLADLQKFKKPTATTTPTLADLQRFKKPEPVKVGIGERILGGIVKGRPLEEGERAVSPTSKLVSGVKRFAEIAREENPFSKKEQIQPETLPEYVAKAGTLPLRVAGAGVQTVARTALEPVMAGASRVLSTPTAQRALQTQPARTIGDVAQRVGKVANVALEQVKDVLGPENYQSLVDTANIVPISLGAKAKPVISPLKQVFQASADTTLPKITLPSKELFTIEKDVKNLLTQTKSITNKVKDLETRGINIKDQISDPAIFKGLKIENRKIVPDQAVQAIDDKIEVALTAKRATLPELDRIIPKQNKQSIRQKAIEDISGQFTPADEKDIIRAIDRQIASLPDELSLTDIDKLRAQFRASARNAKGIQKRDSEYTSLENATRGILFDATDNLPFDTNKQYTNLNVYIRDLLSTKDFIDKTLRGQVVKGGSLGRYVARGIGALAGTNLGPLGTLAGSEVGGFISDILTNNQLGNSMKLKLIKDVTTDPEVIKQAENFLGKVKEYNFPALPEGRRDLPQVQGMVPLRTVPPTTYESGPRIPRATTQTKNMTNMSPSNINPTLPQASKTSSKLDKFGNNSQAGFAALTYKGEKDLTTKILKDLEGKTTVSKQYILDATNRGELKQVERDLVRDLVKNEGDTVNVSNFAKKVKAELLPLKVKTTSNPKGSDPKFFREQTRGDAQYGGARMQPRYEMVNLPDELRGNVKNYRENIYESPIKTSAGETHFGGKTDNYFGHTRIEDMADNKTRRVIEVQSDLYQKGNLEDSVKRSQDFSSPTRNEDTAKNISKLQQYNDPTAHFRMIREEIKKAAQDGKTKLQFPTGETAMKIEGLGQSENNFRLLYEDIETPAGSRPSGSTKLTPEKLSVGERISQGEGYDDQWIITDVLGDGKFKAVPKERLETRAFQINKGVIDEDFVRGFSDSDMNETFDISGKVDTNNPIYKFYEKDVQKYLNKFGGKRVTDDKGVQWIEVPINKDMADQAVEAFGKIQLSPLFGIAGVTAGAAGAKVLYDKKKKKANLPKKK